MKQLYRSIILFLVVWAILFNIDRISQLSGQSVSNLHYYFYLVMPVLTLVIMILYYEKRWNEYLLMGLSALLYTGLIFIKENQPLSNLNLSIIEIVFLCISMVLALRITMELGKLQRSIESVILPKHGHRVYDDKDMARRIIEHEFIRGRRYNHPITALVVEPTQSTIEYDSIIEQATRDFQQTIKNQYLISKLTQIVENETRLTDLVVEWDKQGRLVVVCPETAADSISVLIDRLQTAVKQNLGLTLSFGIAAFPNDARTFDAVLEKAEFQLDHPTGDLLFGISNTPKSPSVPN